MEGLFNEYINLGLLKHTEAKYMVTKESGKAGGFAEKISAADKAGVTSIVIGRPAENKGYSYNELIGILKEKFNLSYNRKVYLVGIGMGDHNVMTIKAKEAFNNSQVIIGAKRMVESLSDFNKPKYISYKYDEIVKFIDEHKEYDKIAIAYSGDVGFYSGAKKMVNMLKGYETEMICGISSVVYFCSKLETSWDDAKLMSIHGKNEDMIGEILYNRKTFSLLGGKESARDLCRQLVEYGLGHVKVAIGENLSYPNESIHRGTAKDFTDSLFEELSVILIINENFKKKMAYCSIDDDEFIRGEVPMTKCEVRNISIAKLNLEEDSIIYDVGAGTGSVAIEMALNSVKGKVFAIEKSKKGIDLININKKKFNAFNLEVVEGLAPEAMEDLPIPTHAFIGGSSGNLEDILKSLLNKNTQIRIVINAVTLETLGEAIYCIKKFSLKNLDITQAVISKGKKIGKYNLMTGQNPIYIISCMGDDKYE